MTTVTMPPPAVASTRRSAICFCSFSCICCACFIICWMFIGDPCDVRRATCVLPRATCDVLPLLTFFDLRREGVQHRLNTGIGERLLPQLRLAIAAGGRGVLCDRLAGGCGCGRRRGCR